ncbi:MAG: hypothetical protein K2L64_00510, partial [Ureaplasma sp.]|nr:hypothetical protein [Ureaplasma sp.]
MTKKQKKILIASLVTPIISVSSITFLSVAISNTICQNSVYNNLNSNSSPNSNLDKSYTFNDLVFDSKEELLNYANNSLVKENQETTVPYKYIVKNDLKNSEFATKEQVDEFINKKIKTIAKISSREIQTSLNGEISASDELNFLSEVDEPNVDVYRGKDNSIHKSEEEAKDTYFNIFEPYYFKDIYFRSKEELKLWLEQNADQWYYNKVPNSIVLTAPNGAVSMPLQINSIKSGEKSTKQYIMDFVKINSLNNVELVKYSENGQDTQFFDEDDLASFKNEWSPDYINVKSNGGKSTYIVDTSKYDEGELNGSYFIQSSSSLSNIKNINLWRETKNTDRIQVENEEDMKILSNFFDGFLHISAEPSGKYNIFFNIEYDEELQTKVDRYYDELYEKFPSIYNSLKELFDTIKGGKRYSAFYKIPILFYHSIDQIVNWDAP